MLNVKMIVTRSNVARRGRLKELNREDAQKKTWWDCVKDDVESLGLSKRMCSPE